MSDKPKIVLGSDHLGAPLKAAVSAHLKARGYEVVDLGGTAGEEIDYPDIGSRVARTIADGEYERGMLFCGTGAGMAIVANKVPGVRAVCVTDPYTAERAIASNNAQIITMGAQITGEAVARMLTEIWLSNQFQSDRSGSKVAKIDALDALDRAAEG